MSEADIRPGELVVDLGAGRGALTRHLVAAGARVVAVELHPGRCRSLRERFAADPVTVEHADVASVQLPRRPFRVVASPPYRESSVLLRRLLAARSPMEGADLVLQRAVVQRVVEGRVPGGTKALYRFAFRRGLAMPRSAFHPRPQVDSAVLVIRSR